MSEAAPRTAADAQLALIGKGAADVIDRGELRAKVERSLAEGRPLKVKLGADPSAPDLHLGHTVVLTKMRQLQDLGHTIQFVIGDFTGRIGDPTGRSQTRKPLTPDEIAANAKTYRDQIGKLLDLERTQIVLNSTWLAPMDFAAVVGLTARYTVARVLERDDFAKRMKEQAPIGMHELLYPLMQGYDSVALGSDIELGGTDQRFNLLVGRDLQRAYGQEPQVAITMPILEGLDGTQKMSKSLGNTIGVSEPPREIFGKVMSISDTLMLRYYLLLTDATEAQVEAMRKGMADGSRHPKALKTELARTLVARFHSPAAAQAATEEFERVYASKGVPDQIPDLALAALQEDPVWIVRVIQRAFGTSSSEAIRMIKGGGVKLGGSKVADPQQRIALGTVQDGTVLQYGKHQFVKLRRG